MAYRQYTQPANFVTMAEVPAANVPSNYMEWSNVRVTSDAVSAGTSASVLVATAHSAVAGDWIVMLTGDEAEEAREVSSVTTDSITLESALSGSPSATETFAVLTPVDAPSAADVKLLLVANDTNQNVYISMDGTNNHFMVPDGGSLSIDLSSLGMHITKGEKIYLKHAGTQPSSGKVYLSRIH